MFDSIKKGFRSGTRSLRTTLAIYFLPISVIPVILISLYSIRVFEESSTDSLSFRASSEREAIVRILEDRENELLRLLKSASKRSDLLYAMRLINRSDLTEILSNYKGRFRFRAYTVDGRFIAENESLLPVFDPVISQDSLKRIKVSTETYQRVVLTEPMGVLTTRRLLIRDSNNLYGILEGESFLDAGFFSQLRNQRQVDIALFSRDLKTLAGSFALPDKFVQSFSQSALSKLSSNSPTFVALGDSRYGGFLYDLPAQEGGQKRWGYVGVFISMNALDATVYRLKVAIVYVSFFLTLTASLLIFIFSKRLVKPIEVLVNTMKRIKSGRLEQIPPVDSAYEIEYLVRSFNEMVRNISQAKQTLEMKLEELAKANEEIRNTQSTLVQSAKMISLGQIVAGVAHELNNPIGFIYSNMDHLSEYVDKMKVLVAEYRKARERLSPAEGARLLKIEKELEVDFLLQDVEDLTRSCVDGARRTREIIVGLRNFSRIEETQMRLSDIHEGVRSTTKLLRSELKDKVTLHEEFGDIPLVECNLSQLNQVFVNLISNAAHAITVRGDVWLRTRLRGNQVEIEIEDNGVGIPADHLSKIFDPFFTTKKIGQGTGLGLSIVYGLIQKHHGHIEVFSTLGKGTRFVITLPLRQPLGAETVPAVSV